MYIAIAGNIGSGKTSLAEILARRCGARLLEENVNNPYLNDFYEDMGRWSFNLQVSFLESRVRQALENFGHGEDIVQDRTVYEDAHIFADNLHDMGLLGARDFETYMQIFGLVSHLVPKPDLLIYLKASVPTLISQIRKRGRPYEMSICESYLARLNDKYERWIGEIYDGAVVVIDMNREDFLLDSSVVDRLMERITEVKSKLP
ncbi:MAG: deoxynucleoside kinase [Rikenellaceae bacterium]|nr:deoxynucleoside kinase [Rikenellaceae bacterium]MCL2692176.1 deoxynucleoside kinase [Rikenellaceae bacterium]